jgi:hypothetical protein
MTEVKNVCLRQRKDESKLSSSDMSEIDMLLYTVSNLEHPILFVVDEQAKVGDICKVCLVHSQAISEGIRFRLQKIDTFTITEYMSISNACGYVKGNIAA